MPLHAEWHEPGRVIIIVPSGHVSVDEINVTADEVEAMLDEATATPVYVLIDDRDLITFGLENRFFAFVSKTIARLLRAKVEFVDTLEDALAFIEQEEKKRHG